MRLMTLGQFQSYLKKLGVSFGSSGGIDAGSITSGTIPAARLPSYVDDVLEFANLAAFPATGETGKIYVAIDTGKSYRWTGTVYFDLGTDTLNRIKYGRTTTLSSSSGVVTIDCAADTDLYDLTLTENITSWSFTNLPAAGTYRDIQVRITQHASSAKTVVSPATAGRTAGGVYVASTALSSIELLTIRVFSDGTKHLFPSGVFA